LASAAFKANKALAAEKGIKRICLHVFKNNQAAQALYKKLGFMTAGLKVLKNM
jgi:ribosomal protein S18 acetylase RimI-like enzyme